MVTSSSSRNLESEHHEGDNNGKVFEKHQEEGNRYEVLVSSLKVKLTNTTTVNKEKEEGDEEGCKTPTSPEYKIPAACPPAPRKPKAVPAKRRGCCHKRVFLDLSDETESLFPPLLLGDLGKKMKKIRSS
nr:uncharacterized protein LOC109192923 [Ipomoea trifida]